MTDHQDENIDVDTDITVDETDMTVDEPASSGERPQYGVGPFTIREVSLAGIWLAAFVVSFFPVAAIIGGPRESLLFGFGSVWTSGLGWVLTIGLPTIAVFLLVLRRLSPQGIRRFGSLGIDQFASVAFSVSTVVWLQLVWETVAFSLAGGAWFRSWVIWVEFFLMLAGVLLTVFGSLIPPFSEDFEGRREIAAHRNARPVRAVSPRPVRPRPEPHAPEAEQGAPADGTYAPVAEADAYDAGTADEPPYGAEPAEADAGWDPDQVRDTYEPVAQEPVADEPVRHQAFWALVPEERDVVDEHGAPLFRIGPTAWALVIEDHGDRFVVRHEDGRVGHLLDIEDVTRG